MCFRVVALAAGIVAVAPAMALDVQPAAPAAAKPAPLSAFKDARSALLQGVQTLQKGDVEKSIPALRYAAEGGETLAQWRLGRMYASGEGVKRNDFMAYQYFARIVREFNEDQMSPQDLPVVAEAFVAIGNYSLSGIPNTAVRRDYSRAHEMFRYAATNFGDPRAQYNLARMYLDGDGVAKNIRQALPWLGYAAAKNHIESQAVLGNILFNGATGVPRQRARGLMYLTLARESAGNQQRHAWIVPLYEKAMAQSTDFDRDAARIELRNYLRRGRRSASALP